MPQGYPITEHPSPDQIQSPVAIAHLLMDGDSPTKVPLIPPDWSKLNFKAVDVLNVSPFIVYKAPKKGEDLSNDERADLAKKGCKDGSFVLEPYYGVYDNSAERLAWVINTARKQNPKIKIIGVQWWGDNNKTLDYLGTDEGRINNYVSTVADIIEEWTLDGWDIDYEWNDTDEHGKPPPPGNLVLQAPKILCLIRKRLETLQGELKRPLYVTMSAATTACLNKEEISILENTYPANPEAAITGKYPINKSVHFVNVQTYSGGLIPVYKNSLGDWLELGFTNKQLLCGICPERTPGKNSPTLLETLNTFDKYNGQGLAGIMSWRLNGGHIAFSNAVQAVIHRHLHPPTDNEISEDQKKKLNNMWEDRKTKLNNMWEDEVEQDKVPWEWSTSYSGTSHQAA